VNGFPPQHAPDWRAPRSLSTEDLDFGGARHRLRGWLLFVLEGFGRFDPEPVPHERLHLLLYFAAVLAPVYRLETPVIKILKHRPLPFYPEAQFTLECLAVSGHVANGGRSGIRDDGWSSDAYRILPAGVETARLLAVSAWGRRVRNFAHDLVQGFLRLDPDSAIRVADEDAFYRHGRMETDDVKAVTAMNDAVRAAEWVADDGDEGPANERDKVFMYLAYLQARMAA
jgi:hypothetical protein